MAEQSVSPSNTTFSMAQLTSLIEALPTGIICHSGDCFILANRAICEMTGYSREQLLGMKFWELFHPRMRELIRERGEARIRNGIAPTSYEVCIVDGAGNERWADMIVTRLEVEGRIVALGSYLDTTERTRAEFRQQHAQQVLGQIIDSNPVPTFVIDRNHVITHWNMACEQVVGLTAAEMVGTKRHQACFYGEERLSMADLIVDGGMKKDLIELYGNKHLTRSSLVKGAYEAEDFFPHLGDNGGVWLYFSSAPLTDADGRIVGAVETLQDFTEQRRAEAELIKSKSRLEEITARQSEQLRVATGELERDKNELVRRLDELSTLHAELKQAQEQLVQSEKLASIGQLAAGVAHEINNPIGFVQSNLGSLEHYFEQIMALLEGYQEGEAMLGGLVKEHEGGAALLERMKQLKKDAELDYLKEDIPDLLKESRDGIVRVKQIVADLKDFSRVDSTQQWEWVDLRTGLNSTLNIVNNEIKYRADVVKEYGELPAVKCLPSQINQVFMNLLVNAAQATPEGRHGTITIRCGTQEGGVWVEISDTGAGIPEENLKKIFDPFFTTKPIGKGTGLGLSLSYGIVQKHGGKIEVRSEVGVGTTFRVSLPIEPPEAAGEE